MELSFGTLVIATDLFPEQTDAPQHVPALVVALNNQLRLANIWTDDFGLLEDVPFRQLIPLLTYTSDAQLDHSPRELLIAALPQALAQYALVWKELQKLRILSL